MERATEWYMRTTLATAPILARRPGAGGDAAVTLEWRVCHATVAER